MSLLNQLRRELVTRLDEAASAPPAHPLAEGPVLPGLLSPIIALRERERPATDPETAPAVELTALCRRTDQIRAAVAAGIRTIYADYQDIKEYADAVAAAREGGAAVYLATPRIEKPGEANLFKHLAGRGADGLLVRNAGGMRFCSGRGVPFVADFSMNAANPLAVELLRSRGALRVTASYDLNVDQLIDLLDATPSSWLEVVIHQRIPMFHMEHCVYCAFLSPGTDATNCGRPCDRHDVRLRDRVGRRASADGRRRLSQYPLQRRAADRRAVPSPAVEARGPSPASRIPRRGAWGRRANPAALPGGPCGPPGRPAALEGPQGQQSVRCNQRCLGRPLISHDRA